MNDLIAEAEKLAIRASVEAGRILMRHYRTGLAVSVKGNNPRDVVTVADKQSNRLICRRIRSRFPEHGIVSEEEAPRKGNEYTWYVDPLDGTNNYSRNSAYFCVSIALGKGKQMLVGVVYCPVTNEMYTAVSGNGARLNGRKIAVSGTAEFEKSYVYCDIGYDERERKKMNLIMRRLTGARSIRVKGSGAYALCELAAGGADAYVDLSSTPWDYAAASLIVEEAGGIMTDLKGRKWHPESDGAVATNSSLRSEFFKRTGLLEK